MTALLEIRDLAVRFGPVRAVDGVSLDIAVGPFGLGLVGESGSGKTTIGRAVLRLVPAAAGQILFEGADVGALGGRALKDYRRAVQIVFQDPDNSLDPRMRVGAAISEALTAHRIVPRRLIGEQTAALLRETGLDPEFASRYPHQLSGGQRQRVAIARALSGERSLSYLLITHNFGVASELCEQTAVLYLGRVAESGPTAELLTAPAHPYTRALRSAVPEVEATARSSRIVLRGEPPDATSPPAGCFFHPRCPLVIDRCRVEVPKLSVLRPGRLVACHRAAEVLAGAKMPLPAPGLAAPE